MDWKDVTSYSRNDTARKTTSTEATAGDLRIVVHRWIHDPGKWFLTAHPVIDQRELKADALEDAQTEGLALVRAWLGRQAKALDAAVGAAR
jgi:hypothetical protein